MAAYYAEDAILLAEGAATIQGREFIEQFWTSTCIRAAELNMARTIEVEQAFCSADLAFARGTVLLEAPAHQFQPGTVAIRYATIWKRCSDLVWRIIVDISNRNPPDDDSGDAVRSSGFVEPLAKT